MSKKNNLLMFLVAVIVSILFIPSIMAEEIETGVVGEYDTKEEAETIASQTEKEDESSKVETSITEKVEPYLVDSVSFDELYSTRIGAMGAAQIFRLSYLLRGYDVSDAVIDTVVITETNTERKTFNSLTEIAAYRALLEASGARVDIRIVSLGLTTRETNVEEVDETFDSILDIARYLITLARNHNNFNLEYDDASYYITTDEDVSQVFYSNDEALEYLRSLRNQYQVSNDEIVYSDGEYTVTEHESGLFDNEESADDYCNSKENEGYTITNKEVVELSSDEIDVDEVLNSDNITISNDDVSFNGISAIGNTGTTVKFTDNNGDTIIVGGEVRLKQIIVNGVEYTPVSNIRILDLPNNTPITIKGSISTNYCIAYRTTIFSRYCIEYKTFDFASNGIVNADYTDRASLLRYFIYNPVSFDFTGNNVKINDNLIHIYKLDFDKSKTYTNPTYTVNAHIYSNERVNQIRVHGKVSKIEILPLITLDITTSRDITKYNALVTATLMGEKTKYVVNYKKTIKDKIDNKDNEATDSTTNSENNVGRVNNTLNPKTGDNIYSYIILLISSLVFMIITVNKLNTKNNN